MSFLIVIAIVVVLRAFISRYLLNIIVDYIGKKPPGLQSVLDFLILELINWKKLQILITTTMMFSGVLYGQLNPWKGLALTAIAANASMLVAANVQMILLVKAILLFKQEWLADVQEDEVLLLTRIATIAYAALRFVIDYALPARLDITVEFLTGKELSS